MMTEETVVRVFDRVEELHDQDGNLSEIEWEVIGGETTLMPFEWWEKMLPYMLDRIARINERLALPGSLNFLTNLMIRDTRYFDLFNAYGDHPAFSLYTSWEPDTRRFGTRNKLFPKFLENLDRLNLPSITLDVIMTKGVIDLGGRWVVDTFVPHGITDFSCKMLSPYGSGKAFFGPNMIDFASMSEFLSDLDAAKPDHVTYTPGEEALSSLYRGTSFQCNGNFYYDLSIEPDGLTHFNANQTADEAATGSLEVRLEDPQWARKIIFENTIEAAGKLNLKHPACHQCEFLRYCNAGWWHYKTDQPLVEPFGGSECAGLRRHWNEKRTELRGSLFDISTATHRSEMRAAVRDLHNPSPCSEPQGEGVARLRESEIRDFDAFFALDPRTAAILIDENAFLGKTPAERMVYYDARGFDVAIDDDLVSDLLVEDPKTLEAILLNQVCLVHRRATPFTAAQILDITRRAHDWVFTAMMRDGVAALRLAGSSTRAGPPVGPPATDAVPQQACGPSGLVADARNEEMFRWLLAHGEVCDGISARMSNELSDEISLDARGLDYLVRLTGFVARETSVRNGAAAR